MGRRKRSFAFLIVVGGILTFFRPLVTTDPPVIGRTRWSAWNLACQLQAGNLPPVRHYSERNEFLLSIPLMAAAIYLLLVFALIALCFSCSPEVRTKIAVLGWFTSWFWRGDRISFEEMFYGDFSYQNFSLVRHVGFGQLTIVLLGVMLALFLVSRSEDIDNEPYRTLCGCAIGPAKFENRRSWMLKFCPTRMLQVEVRRILKRCRSKMRKCCPIKG